MSANGWMLLLISPVIIWEIWTTLRDWHIAKTDGPKKSFDEMGFPNRYS